ncbi:MAG: hypothetical protein IJS32_09275 [Kiritimatiellae bacterium]|nr:hypothetical protein [Kiritimatiellia bacterium]
MPKKAPGSKLPGDPIGKEETAFARALQKDLRPVAEALRTALARGEGPGELKRRLERILRECGTESAAALEEAMKAAGELEAAKDAEDAKEEKLANDIANPCPQCHRNMPKDGPCSFCAKRKANHEAGKAAFDEVAKTHKDKVGAMERDSIGKIDFIWGDDTEGICHIMGKHKADAQMIPGVIAYGDVYEDEANGKYFIVKKKNFVSLRKMNAGNHYLITGFTADSPDYVARIRKEHRLVEKGE